MNYLLSISYILIYCITFNLCNNAFASGIEKKSCYFSSIIDGASPQSTQEDPIAGFTTSEKLCAKDTIWFTNSTTGDYTNVLWNFGDSLDAVAWENPYHIYSKEGKYTVTLTAILNIPGGTPVVSQYTETIEVNPAPEVTILYDGSETDSIGIIGKAMKVEIKNGKDYPLIIWKHSEETSASISINQPGIYNVMVENNLGCSITAKTKGIIFKDPIDDAYGIKVVNNIITPNGDNYNEFLIIEDLDDTSVFPNSVKISIFNVWGIKVFESGDYRQEDGWEGKDVDAGTYYYHITTKGKPGKTGYVDVIK